MESYQAMPAFEQRREGAACAETVQHCRVGSPARRPDAIQYCTAYHESIFHISKHTMQYHLRYQCTTYATLVCNVRVRRESSYVVYGVGVDWFTRCVVPARAESHGLAVRGYPVATLPLCVLSRSNTSEVRVGTPGYPTPSTSRHAAILPRSP